MTTKRQLEVAVRATEVAHLRDKLKIAMEALEGIMDTARASDGVEFYAMIAEQALREIKGDE